MTRRVVVTGGAGFLGSHFCDALVDRGDEVLCVDNLSTGQRTNIDHLVDHPAFRFIEADITERLDVDGPVTAVAHLASPASPMDFASRAIDILEVGSLGTKHAIELAARHGARFLLASTSEVYGEAVQHPQTEESWGRVDPLGVRGPYDESKRFAEALTAAHVRSHGLDGAIVRIFNTYGPRMRLNDGRIVPNFLAQAETGQHLTVFGDGTQTRSFCYVTDTVAGLTAVMDSDRPGPYNIGMSFETTVLELAELVLEITGADVDLVHLPAPQDDPTRRRPVTDKAFADLGWTPQVDLRSGLASTHRWFRVAIAAAGHARVAADLRTGQ